MLELLEKETLRTIGWRDEFWKIPTHRISEMPTEAYILSQSQFVMYRYPLPRDYGQIGSQYQRTAEPVKISLVSDDDLEWRVAVENWLWSELFVQEPFGLEQNLRKPKLDAGRYRVHYARFLLPIGTSHTGEQWFDKRYSPCFTAYYVNLPEKERLYFSEFTLDSAYNAEPISWNAYGKRAYTIPEDWLTNRIDENAHKYTLFA